MSFHHQAPPRYARRPIEKGIVMNVARRPARRSSESAHHGSCWLLLAVSLSACTGGEQPAANETANVESEAAASAATAAHDPCSLLTPEEVSQVVGAPVEEVERTESAYTSHLTCSYWGAAPVSVMVSFWQPGYTPPTADFYRRKEQQVRESYGQVEFVDGLGTAAMWLEEAEMLHAVVPGYELIFIAPKAQARLLMEKALAGLM
jgi:hypothetical protein